MKSPRKIPFGIKLFIASIVLICLVFIYNARPQAHLVKRVIDGDTIQFSNGKIVRLIGVDTPETKHPRKLVEYYGKEASTFTRKMVEGKAVRLEYDQQKIDKYGRLLAYIYLTIGNITTAYDDTIIAGHVISSDPVAGTLVTPGTPVDLVVFLGPDSDNDGIPDEEDNCPTMPNGPNLGTCTSISDTPGMQCTSNGDCASCGPGSPGFCSMGQEDGDGDAVGDVCDNCVDDYNDTQLDNDGDGTGNACDDDDDEDGIDDGDDNCPNVDNPSQTDSDSDGIGDACDPYRWALVPKTGQITSYATGDDGDLEKGVARPNPRFTDNLDGTVTDNLTGLIWLKNANCIATNYPGFDNDGTAGGV